MKEWNTKLNHDSTNPPKPESSLKEPYDKASDRTRAKKRVLHLLERSQKSEKQIRDKLREGGYLPDVIDEAVEYARSYHYIDDERFARDFVRMGCEKKSRIRLAADLRSKGLDDSLIELAIAEEYCADDVEVMRGLLRKRGYSPELPYSEKMKHFRFLSQRGYPSESIRRAMEVEED